jgi:hypothetical protein
MTAKPVGRPKIYTVQAMARIAPDAVKHALALRRPCFNAFIVETASILKKS